MPRRRQRGTLPCLIPTVLEDDAAAEFRARKLVRELKKQTLVHPVGWTMVVREGERDVCFVRVDPYDLRRKT